MSAPAHRVASRVELARVLASWLVEVCCGGRHEVRLGFTAGEQHHIFKGIGLIRLDGDRAHLLNVLFGIRPGRLAHRGLTGTNELGTKDD